MNKNFIFFLVASIVLILSIAVLYIAPIINRRLGDKWKTDNCLLFSDTIDQMEEYIIGMTDNEKKEYEEEKKYYKKLRDICYWKKAMYGLEFSAFTFDVIFGFICSLLGFIHYLDEGKSFITKTGLIGLVSGAIGFVLTLVYLIYSILVYTSPSDVDKVEENMAYAHWDSSNKVYLCNFYDKDNRDSIRAKYSELGKKQYNYNTELYQSYKHDQSSEINECAYDYVERCEMNNNFTANHFHKSKECPQLYLEPTEEISNLDLSNRWLTSIILSALTIICNLCLAFLGFLLFKNKEESGEVKVV